MSTSHSRKSGWARKGAAAVSLLLAGQLLSTASVTILGDGGRASAASDARVQGTVSFATVNDAYEQGIGAVRAGKPELAVSAFEFAGDQNHVPSLYYLGMLYANNDERLTDHAKAFNLFHRIVEQFAYVDRVTDYRSAYVARAAVKLAEYHRNGVPALRLKADPREAIELLNHAATYFGDLEAQFQLAKMHLTGEGVQGNERYGLHWLSSLARKNHPGAQAFLAELLWRGKFVQKDPNQALVWGTLAVEGSADQDRLWIEEIHQTIYCGTAPGVREQAGQLVADWRRRIPSGNGPRGGTEGVDHPLAAGRAAQAMQGRGHANAGAVRSCANGEPVPTIVPGALPKPVPVPMPGERTDAPLPSPLPVLDKNKPATGTIREPANGSGQTAAAVPGPAAAVAGSAASTDMRPVSTPTPPAFAPPGFREFDKNDGTRGRR